MAVQFGFQAKKEAKWIKITKHLISPSKSKYKDVISVVEIYTYVNAKPSFLFLNWHKWPVVKDRAQADCNLHFNGWHEFQNKHIVHVQFRTIQFAFQNKIEVDVYDANSYKMLNVCWNWLI